MVSKSCWFLSVQTGAVASVVGLLLLLLELVVLVVFCDVWQYEEKAKCMFPIDEVRPQVWTVTKEVLQITLKDVSM